MLSNNIYVQFLILMFTYISLDFLSLMAYAVAADTMVKWLKANPRTINTISACALVTVAVFIAITQNY